MSDLGWKGGVWPWGWPEAALKSEAKGIHSRILVFLILARIAEN